MKCDFEIIPIPAYVAVVGVPSARRDCDWAHTMPTEAMIATQASTSWTSRMAHVAESTLTEDIGGGGARGSGENVLKIGEKMI